ncbi:MAG: hypothetical protein LBR74_00920 [Eubacterium sp.]|jgi:hypothetical protein|nr:hypothetical protein [Eubacterium sp.]
MSMPTFPEPSSILNSEEAVNAILTSIALEESALSHILNAEGEKIQYALKHIKHECDYDMELILKVNESVASTLENINDIQLVLINKLNKVLKYVLQKPDGKQKSDDHINQTTHGHPRNDRFCMRRSHLLRKPYVLKSLNAAKSDLECKYNLCTNKCVCCDIIV